MMPLVLLLAVVGCGSVVPEASGAPDAPVPSVRPALMGLAEALPNASERAVRSVVSVAPRRAGRFGAVTSNSVGLGSGVVVREDGIVVTNNHVVAGAQEVVVTLPGGERAQAEVVGTDPSSDLAVLRLVDPPDDLVPLPFGDSDALRLGEVVLAVGTPFGVGQTVTMGIVSAKERAGMGIVDYEDFIQTDAAINPGNSGGALVDLHGELVGINTAIFSRSGGSMGIGFAIPASMAEKVVTDILEDGSVDRGWLGVRIADSDVGGVLIAAVEPRTPAAQAGLRAGDVVVAFDGKDVRNAVRFRNAVAGAGAAERFTATVLREGHKRTVEGTLGRLPPL